MQRNLLISGAAAVIIGIVCLGTPLQAADVSSYRTFRLGMTVSDVVAVTAQPAESITTVFSRPLLIQELEWSPPMVPGSASDASGRDSVSLIQFGFCGGVLYRIVVSYDRIKTEGMTDGDMVELLSGEYGTAVTGLGTIITSSARQAYLDTEDVLARWEDPSSSVNLFARRYQSSFGLVIYSKRLATMARAAILEGTRLDDLEAPQRRIAEQKARDGIEHASHAKMRVANKAAFRY